MVTIKTILLGGVTVMRDEGLDLDSMTKEELICVLLKDGYAKCLHKHDNFTIGLYYMVEQTDEDEVYSNGEYLTFQEADKIFK